MQQFVKLLRRTAVFTSAVGLASGLVIAAAGSASAANAHPSVTPCSTLHALDFVGTDVNIHQDANTSSPVNGQGSQGSDCWAPLSQVTGQRVCRGSYCTDQWEFGNDLNYIFGAVSWAYLSVS